MARRGKKGEKDIPDCTEVSILSNWLMNDKSSIYVSIQMRHINFQRDKMKEHCITKFILSVTHGDRDTNLKFEDWLKDGQVLME